MKLVIEIDEDIRIAISRMGLLRIPDEMQKKVDKAIQHGTPIDQEPKTGHWITHIKSDRRDDYWPTNPKCSECSGEPYFSNSIYNYKFCPYCGARMSEVSE